MPASKKNIFPDGFDELVFANRHRDYGAYPLRKEYPGKILLGLAFAIGSVLVLLSIPFFVKEFSPKKHYSVEVKLSDAPILGVQIPEPPAAEKNLSSAGHTPKIDFTKIKDATRKDTAQSGSSSIEDKSAKSGTGSAVGNSNEGTPNVDVLPSFPGGTERMNEFIRVNITYPRSEQEQRRQGVVEVGFTVRADGSLTDIHIVKSISKVLDEEALRVIKMMPDWMPGTQKGRTVDNVPVKISITFKL